jgi:TPP-dependent pyruvate/acetoin dehydrogenase alpha subunit
MHVGSMAKGMIPGIAIVGGGIPVAAGMALAFKMQKTGQIAACFFGDGAVAEGAFHEGVNMAAIWDLPVIFVCENNLYGASTRRTWSGTSPACRGSRWSRCRLRTTPRGC